MSNEQINLNDLYRIIGVQQVRIAQLQAAIQRAEMEKQRLQARINQLQEKDGDQE